MKTIKNYISGRLMAPASGKYLDVIEPATGKAYARVPDSDAGDVEHAVEAAKLAFPDWSETPAAERSRILIKIADLIEQNLASLAKAESIDNGKPFWLAESVDIPRAAANMRFFATAILHAQSEAHQTDAAALNYTLRKARGVAGLISPWNLPLYLFTWKVAPALAVGNTAVAKPSEITPMTAFLFSELCRKAGLPPGVLNVVHGSGRLTGCAIVGHPEISTISFTGGTATGAAISKIAAPMFKKLSLELGGKNPNIIFADAEMDQAIETTIKSSFLNQGEICLCGSRIFIEKKAYKEFVKKFVAKVKELQVGDPSRPQTHQGALVSADHLLKIKNYVRLAKKEGGEILCGGRPPAKLPKRCRDGFFFEPTVIARLSPRCRVNQEEIFGPVVTVTPFTDEEEALEYANGTKYGLSATVWTSNLSRAHRVAEKLDAGTVWINCWLLRDLRVPFGGMKQSGVGREGGEEALRFFTEPKNVCVKMEHR